MPTHSPTHIQGPIYLVAGTKMEKGEAILLLALPEEQFNFVMRMPDEQAMSLLKLPNEMFNDVMKVQANDSAMTELELSGT